MCICHMRDAVVIEFTGLYMFSQSRTVNNRDDLTALFSEQKTRAYECGL